MPHRRVRQLTDRDASKERGMMAVRHEALRLARRDLAPRWWHGLAERLTLWTGIRF
jgi:hypothetical protein